MAQHLKVGVAFNLSGYEPMAMIDSMDGNKIVVVSNTSSHFLVALQSKEDWQLSTKESNMATFLASFEYDADTATEEDIEEEEQTRVVYREALEAAIEFAMTH